MRQLPGRAALRAGLVGLAAAAVALSGTPSAQAASRLSQTSNATYQTNGRVTDVLTVGGTTYLAGEFTSVRPPGAPAGSRTVPRAHLAAVNSTTGALLPWNPKADRPVYTLAASPDGNTIYAGGNFTQVGGQPRKHLAAMTAGGGTVTGFRADTVGQVKALAVSAGRVYLGGTFTSVDGQPRSRLAAVTTAGALVSTWRPAANDTVRVLALSPDGGSVYAGGEFGAINGASAQKNLVKLSASGGGIQAWASHPGYPVSALVVTPTRVYVGGDGSGGHAGSYSPGGVRGWVTQTDGGVQAIALLDGVLYIGGHFDKVCVGDTAGGTSGFQCPSTKAVRHKLVAVDAQTGGTDGWNPGANSSLGVYGLAAVGGRLHVGGAFTVLGGRAQQGYGSFS